MREKEKGAKNKGINKCNLTKLHNTINAIEQVYIKR